MRLVGESWLWGCSRRGSSGSRPLVKEGTREQKRLNVENVIEYQNGHQRTDFEKKTEMRWIEEDTTFHHALNQQRADCPSYSQSTLTGSSHRQLHLTPGHPASQSSFYTVKDNSGSRSGRASPEQRRKRLLAYPQYLYGACKLQIGDFLGRPCIAWSAPVGISFFFFYIYIFYLGPGLLSALST